MREVNAFLRHTNRNVLCKREGAIHPIWSLLARPQLEYHIVPEDMWNNLRRI